MNKANLIQSKYLEAKLLEDYREYGSDYHSDLSKRVNQTWETRDYKKTVKIP